MEHTQRSADQAVARHGWHNTWKQGHNRKACSAQHEADCKHMVTRSVVDSRKIKADKHGDKR